MTAPRPDQALLARLVDEATLEFEPIEEVRADLASFDVDPAASIRLARRLAADAGSPAGKLLGRIVEAESLDDEIRRLEQADIAQIRAQLPPGDAAAGTAHAHRASGRDSNVIGLRRRRSRRLTYGLSGLAAALAASLVFYVGMSQYEHEFVRRDSGALAPTAPADKVVQAQTETAASTPSAALEKQDVSDQPSQAPTVAAAPADLAETASTAPATPASPANEDVQASMAPAASAPEPAPLAEQRTTDDETSDSKDAITAPEGMAQTEANGRAKSTEQSVTAELADRQPGEGKELDRRLLLGGDADAQRDELKGGAISNVMLPPLGIERPVVALLVVDPKLLPAGYRENQYSAGNLAMRLADARRVAGGLPVVALVTLQYADGPRDAVVLQSRSLEQSRQTEAAGAVVGETASGSAAAGYEVRLLDRR